MTVEEMMKKNEEFKKKGLLLSPDDLMERLLLRDSMRTESSKLKQEVVLAKLELDKEKAKKIIEYKSVKDENGKALTEKVIEANIKQDFYDKDVEIIVKKSVSDLLYERAESIIDFINIVKMDLKSKNEAFIPNV